MSLALHLRGRTEVVQAKPSQPVQVSNQRSLEAAVDAAAAFLNKAVKPVLVAGGHLRSQKAMGAFAGAWISQ